MFLEVALDFIRASSCLKNLTITMSNTEAETGQQFLNDLAETDCETVENLDLSCPETEKMCCKWFQYQDEPVQALIEFMNR